MPKRSKEQWLQLFKQHAQSGLSANRFCKGHGLCPKYFSLRKKQLHPSTQSKVSQPDKAFTKATVVAKPQMSISTSLVLHHAQSRLVLPPDVDIRWLASLLSALN